MRAIDFEFTALYDVCEGGHLALLVDELIAVVHLLLRNILELFGFCQGHFREEGNLLDEAQALFALSLLELPEHPHEVLSVQHGETRVLLGNRRFLPDGRLVLMRLEGGLTEAIARQHSLPLDPPLEEAESLESQ